ncbi:DUF4056 domain-containing protein [Jejubacter calystegiae]|nr:DUF4056 domain-containing protein [Jejubacter calystegiae]
MVRLLMVVMTCLSLFGFVGHSYAREAHGLHPPVQPIPAPESLRPCCAFGHNLHVSALNIPVPLYQPGNVLTLETLGHHQYNDSTFGALKNLMGISEERNGLIYTRRGGFIDIAHVRDTADNTLYLFSQIYPQLGQEGRIFFSNELGLRRIQLNRFTPPAEPARRYELAAWLAAHLAWQMAQWHEIAQWYGFESVPDFPEEISAFSPEDLYSNLLGARLAARVILQGEANSLQAYNQAMDKALHAALHNLEAVDKKGTEQRFRDVDGEWWDSQRRVPEKFLVLNRNYDVGDRRSPTPLASETREPRPLALPQRIGELTLAQLGELRIYPTNDMKALPAPETFYAPHDFPALAQHAAATDRVLLQKQKR